MEYVIRHSVFKSPKNCLHENVLSTFEVKAIALGMCYFCNLMIIENVLDTFIQSDTDIWLHLRIMNDDLLSVTVRNYGEKRMHIMRK